MNAHISIDLHAHSTASDGVLSPTVLVEHAIAEGVEVFALTDHDTVSGVVEAAGAAAGGGLRFLAGVEVSVTWRHQLLHIVGLGVDPEHARLIGGLDSLRENRNRRAVTMAGELEQLGIPGALAGAQQYSDGESLGRTHFARWLVEIGRAKDMHDCFNHFLVRGKPGYVPMEWASLAEAVAWIHAAGGVAVIAHPARYKVSRKVMEDLLGEFRDLGGRGIEVLSGSQGLDHAPHFARLAKRFGLLGSSGSDFHGPGHPKVGLGGLPPLPEGLRPIIDILDVAQ